MELNICFTELKMRHKNGVSWVSPGGKKTKKTGALMMSTTSLFFNDFFFQDLYQY